MTLDGILLAGIVLTAVCLALVRLTIWARLGSILGFLTAGVVLGPNTPGFTITTHVDQLLMIGELGIVLLMFTIGLEMNARRVWSMRRLIFGLGSVQILLTGGMIAAALSVFFGLGVVGAAVLGLGLALSSTAIVLQTLGERGETATEHGRAAFSVLVMQDLAAVPLLIGVGFLSVSAAATTGEPWYLQAALALASVPLLIVIARWPLPWALRWSARFGSASSFAALVIVALMAASVLMDVVGLSMAMGAFIVGMILSASEFRFAVQSTVLPIKGLFMGLYFVAVGMSLDIAFALAHIGELLAALLVVELCKVLGMAAAAALFGLSRGPTIRLAFLLAPCGEFGFVLFAAAYSGGVIGASTFAYALVVVSASMAITPLTVAGGYALARRLAPASPSVSPGEAVTEGLSGHVVVTGYNLAGRLLCRLLERTGLPYVCFDYAYDRVLAGRAEGHAVELGDVSNPAMQSAASIAKARLVAVMLERPERAQRLAEQLRVLYPSVSICVAAPDLRARDELWRRGIADAIAISVEGNLQLAALVLRRSGVAEEEVDQLMDELRRDDYSALRTPFPAPAVAGERPGEDRAPEVEVGSAPK